MNELELKFITALTALPYNDWYDFLAEAPGFSEEEYRKLEPIHGAILDGMEDAGSSDGAYGVVNYLYVEGSDDCLEMGRRIEYALDRKQALYCKEREEIKDSDIIVTEAKPKDMIETFLGIIGAEVRIRRDFGLYHVSCYDGEHLLIASANTDYHTALQEVLFKVIELQGISAEEADGYKETIASTNKTE